MSKIIHTSSNDNTRPHPTFPTCSWEELSAMHRGTIEQDAKHAAHWMGNQIEFITSEYKKNNFKGIVFAEIHAVSAHALVEPFISISPDISSDLGLEKTTNTRALDFNIWADNNHKTGTISTAELQAIQEHLEGTLPLTTFLTGDPEISYGAPLSCQFQAFAMNFYGRRVVLSDASQTLDDTLNMADKDTRATTEAYEKEQDITIANKNNILASGLHGTAIRNRHIFKKMPRAQQVGLAHSGGRASDPDRPYERSIRAYEVKQNHYNLHPTWTDQVFTSDIIPEEAKNHPGHRGEYDDPKHRGFYETDAVKERYFVAAVLGLAGANSLADAFFKAQRESEKQVVELFEQTYAHYKTGGFRSKDYHFG